MDVFAVSFFNKAQYFLYKGIILYLLHMHIVTLYLLNYLQFIGQVPYLLDF